MNLSAIHGILTKLASVTSRNDKLGILKSNQDNADLRGFFRLALDGNVNFYVLPPKTLPAPATMSHLTDNAFDPLSKRLVTGNAARDYVYHLLSTLSKESQDVLCRILERDPKCGVNYSTVNAVWPNLVYEFDIQKGESLNDWPTGKEYKCKWSGLKKKISLTGRLASCKMDGRRCLVEKKGGEFQFFSSSGKPLPNLERAAECLKAFNIPDGFWLDGELLGEDWNSSMSITASGNVDEKWALYLFDMISPEEWTGNVQTPLSFRLGNMEIIIGEGSKHVKLAKDYGIAQSEEHAEAMLNRAFEEGYEGLMFKELDAPYIRDRTQSWLKAKAEETVDVQVVDVEEGTGKNAGRMGAFACVDDKGRKFSVGIGLNGSLTDQDRIDFWRDRSLLVGCWIEVRQDKVHDKDKIISRFPRFVRLRKDK